MRRGGPLLFRTYTGRMVDLFSPKPGDVCLEDIARALSHICRFGGHVEVDHFSVAQHSVLVSHACHPEHALIGLLHDASEAYVADLVTPLKHGLRGYAPIEKLWQRAIGDAFGLKHKLVDMPTDIKAADLRALATEMRDLFSARDHSRVGVPPLDERILALGPSDAYRLFMARFDEIAPKRRR